MSYQRQQQDLQETHAPASARTPERTSRHTSSSRSTPGQAKARIEEPFIDIYEDAGALVLKADLPGVRPADIDVQVDGSMLTLSGERRWDNAVARESCRRVERPHGRFRRTFTLPEGVEARQMIVQHEDGVLSLTLPRRVEARTARPSAATSQPPQGHSARSGLTRAEEAVLVQGGASKQDLIGASALHQEAARQYDSIVAASLTVDEAARHLGVEGSRVRQRLAARTLYGIKVGHLWRLPAFQFRASGSTVPEIGKVVAKLPGDLSPVAVERWFTTPNVDLHTRDDEERPLTPLEWLETGHPPATAADLAVEL